MLGRASSVMFYLVLSCRCSHPVVPVPKRSPMPNISKKQTHQTRKTRILLSTMSPVSMVLISIVADVAASFGRRRWRLCKLQRRSDLKKTCKPNANPNAKPMQSQCKANAKPMQSQCKAAVTSEPQLPVVSSWFSRITACPSLRL